VARVVEGVAVEKRINSGWIGWTVRLFCVMEEGGV
jgi:hypothetical protein